MAVYSRAKDARHCLPSATNKLLQEAAQLPNNMTLRNKVEFTPEDVHVEMIHIQKFDVKILE